MQKLPEKGPAGQVGFAQVFVLLLLLAGLAASAYLVQQKTSFLPKAYDGGSSLSGVITPTPTPTPGVSVPITFGPEKRVFMTSTTYTGNLGGLKGADAKCQARADAVALGGTWKAWLSNSKIAATSRLVHNKGIYKAAVGGRSVIANNWADLTNGTLINGVGIDEYGRLRGISDPWDVWTNTKPDGSIASTDLHATCGGWTSESSSVAGNGGMSWKTDFRWTHSGTPAQGCNTQKRLYCFEQ